MKINEDHCYVMALNISRKMLKRVVVLFFVVGFIQTASALLNASCVTPNGEEALCIPINTCAVLRDALRSALAVNDSTVISFVQKSQCGYESVPLVCCGSTARLIFSNVLSIFSKPLPKEETVALEDFKLNFLPNRTVCGLEKETERIVGGKITDFYEFPWVVALEYNSNIDGASAGIRCGGSLINNRYVVTAAHCMDTVEFKLIRVWLGDWKLSSDPDCFDQTNTKNQDLNFKRVCNDPVIKLQIAKKIPHAFYDNGLNDIALLKLERDVSFTDYIRPICLPPDNMPYSKSGARLIISGWGYTRHRGNTSDYKLKVDVPVVPNTQCETVSRDRFITDSLLCAGGEIGKDSCTGDSGGPVMRKYADASNQIQWYLEGLVSWGNGCGSLGVPAVYTRLASYIYWITYHVIEEDAQSTSNFDYEAAKRSLLPQRTVCGLERNVNQRVDVGGVTRIYELPWVVRLADGTKFICGGSLITNRFVFTAASCFNSVQPDRVRVWLGAWRNSRSSDCANQITSTLCSDATLKLKISKLITYPYHTSFGVNDVALLKLEQQITFTDYISPICLPLVTSNPSNGVRVMTSGWGQSSNANIKLEKSLVSNSECINLYRTRYQDRNLFLKYHTLCATGERDKHLCEGDGGAPLMKQYEDRQTGQSQWFQLGISSGELGCGEAENRRVYTNTFEWVNWILRTIAEEV